LFVPEKTEAQLSCRLDRRQDPVHAPTVHEVGLPGQRQLRRPFEHGVRERWFSDGQSDGNGDGRS